jgi:hypothetical protein
MTTNQNQAQLVDSLIPPALKEQLVTQYKANRLKPNVALQVLRNENINLAGGIDRYDVADWLRWAARQEPAKKPATRKKKESS